MDRLTAKYEGTYAPRGLCSFDRDGNATDCDLCYESCKAPEDGSMDCTGCEVDRCFRRLAEYEDTGLTPEQIKELDRLYQEKCREVAKYQKYDTLRQQGRMPVLPCTAGQKVYVISHNPLKIISGEVASIRISKSGLSLRIYVPESRQYISRLFEQVGRSVFFKQAAAGDKLNLLKGRAK